MVKRYQKCTNFDLTFKSLGRYSLTSHLLFGMGIYARWAEVARCVNCPIRLSWWGEMSIWAATGTANKFWAAVKKGIRRLTLRFGQLTSSCFWSLVTSWKACEALIGFDFQWERWWSFDQVEPFLKTFMHCLCSSPEYLLTIVSMNVEGNYKAFRAAPDFFQHHKVSTGCECLKGEKCRVS